MTDEEKDFLLGLEVRLLSRIYRDSELHYNNVVFTPRFPGDTPFDKYISFLGKADYQDWKELSAFTQKYCM